MFVLASRTQIEPIRSAYPPPLKSLCVTGVTSWRPSGACVSVPHQKRRWSVKRKPHSSRTPRALQTRRGHTGCYPTGGHPHRKIAPPPLHLKRCGYEPSGNRNQLRGTTRNRSTRRDTAPSEHRPNSPTRGRTQGTPEEPRHANGTHEGERPATTPRKGRTSHKEPHRDLGTQ